MPLTPQRLREMAKQVESDDCPASVPATSSESATRERPTLAAARGACRGTPNNSRV